MRSYEGESFSKNEDPLEIRVGRKRNITKIYQRAKVLQKKSKERSSHGLRTITLNKSFIRTTIGRMIFSQTISEADKSLF